MNIVFWMTPAGTLDEGGMPQPAYLNFRQHLLKDPASPESFKACPARCIMRSLPFSLRGCQHLLQELASRRAVQRALPTVLFNPCVEAPSPYVGLEVQWSVCCADLALTRVCFSCH